MTVGLDAPKLPRWRPSDPGLDRSGSVENAFRLFAVGVAICVSLALGFLVWLMFGTIPAVITAMFTLAVIGSILDPLL